MYFEILKKIRTREEAWELLGQLDALETGLYSARAAVKIPVLLQGVYETRENKKAFLEELKNQLLNLAVVSLTVALKPDESFLEKLSGWVKVNIGERAVLEIEVDAAILGGALVSYNGKYRDYSLRKALKAV